MMLLVGLGNPGNEYAGTRHNFGFLVLDALAQRAGITAWQSKFSALLAKGRLQGVDVTLLKPQTFMNLSGRSVQPAASFLRMAPSSILVLHDELDVPFGQLRLKESGGHGGHNGVRSIQECLGRNDFLRLRLGIGRPPPEHRQDVVSYVLSKFSSEQASELPQMQERAVDIVAQVVTEGIATSMNRANTKAKKG